MHVESVKKLPPELINLAVKTQELPPHRRYLAEELIAQLYNCNKIFDKLESPATNRSES